MINLTKLQKIIANLPECGGPMITFEGDLARISIFAPKIDYVEFVTWLDAAVKAMPVLMSFARVSVDISQMELRIAEAYDRFIHTTDGSTEDEQACSEYQGLSEIYSGKLLELRTLMEGIEL